MLGTVWSTKEWVADGDYGKNKSLFQALSLQSIVTVNQLGGKVRRVEILKISILTY